MGLTVFEYGMDSRCNDPKKPTVAKLHATRGKYKYCVIGTAYGFLRTRGGDVRTWLSYSGAYKAAKAYQAGVLDSC
jgi:hypothetical protein